jgi:predicted GIY-YIG superfamily endonuclease
VPAKVRAYSLYALELEGGKYYVGITAYKDVTIRFNQHLNDKGAKWTKRYKPVRIIEARSLGLCGQAIPSGV